MVKKTKEEEMYDTFALIGVGYIMAVIQTLMVIFVLALTDFDFITKWLFIFPISICAMMGIFFAIKFIQIELRYS